MSPATSRHSYNDAPHSWRHIKRPRTENMNTLELTTRNILTAAGAWLQRIGAEPHAVAVVTVAPNASIGVWIPGRENVGARPIDDASVKVMEAAGPAIEFALKTLDDEARAAALEAVVAGARLQLLLMPTAGELGLRLVGNGRCVALAGLVCDPEAP